MAAVVELLEAQVRFGGSIVVDRLSFRLEHGEALGVVGPNGAGKSTVVKLLTGELRPTAGRVYLHGEHVTDRSPADRARRGLAHAAQVPRPFGRLTVFENCLVGASFATPLGARARTRACIDALERTGLIRHADEPAASLTALQRRRLELARALATGPSVLVLDEITGGMRASEVERLVEVVRSIHRSGVSIIWVEHLAHALLEVVDRLMAIDFGRKITDGDPREVMASADVRRVHLGTEP